MPVYLILMFSEFYLTKASILHKFISKSIMLNILNKLFILMIQASQLNKLLKSPTDCLRAQLKIQKDRLLNEDELFVGESFFKKIDEFQAENQAALNKIRANLLQVFTKIRKQNAKLQIQYYQLETEHQNQKICHQKEVQVLKFNHDKQIQSLHDRLRVEKEARLADNRKHEETIANFQAKEAQMTKSLAQARQSQESQKDLTSFYESTMEKYREKMGEMLKEITQLRQKVSIELSQLLEQSVCSMVIQREKSRSKDPVRIHKAEKRLEELFKFKGRQ